MLNSDTERTLWTLDLKVEVWQLQVLLLPDFVYQVFPEPSPAQLEGIFPEPLSGAAEVFAPRWGQMGLLEFMKTFKVQDESFMMGEILYHIALDYITCSYSDQSM